MRDGDHEERRGQGEADPGRDAAKHTRTVQPDTEPDLAGGGARQELAERQQRAIFLAIKPFLAVDEAAAEIAKMRHRPAKGTYAQQEKRPQDLEGAQDDHKGGPSSRPSSRPPRIWTWKCGTSW